MLLEIAPLEFSFDMFVAIFFCYFPPILWFYFGWKASRSGSIYKKKLDHTPNGYEWAESDINVSFWSTAQFKIGLLWIVLGTIFFFGLLWPDHHDVWFITK